MGSGLTGLRIVATDSTEARAIVGGLTGPRHMGSGLSGYRAMTQLKPQLMVLLVQVTWVLVLVVTEPWVLSQSHDHCFYESRTVAPGPSGLTTTRTMASGFTGQEPQQHKD